MRTPVLSCLVNTDYVTVRLADRNLNRLRFALARRLDGWTARHLTAHVHANSEAVKAAAIRDLKLAPDKITVILHARDADRLGQPTPERRERARARLGLRDDQYVLVNIGRQDYQKGQRYLLEALASVVRDHPNIVLLVAGRAGDVSADLLHLVHEMNLERHAKVLGECEGQLSPHAFGVIENNPRHRAGLSLEPSHHVFQQIRGIVVRRHAVAEDDEDGRFRPGVSQ